MVSSVVGICELIPLENQFHQSFQWPTFDQVFAIGAVTEVIGWAGRTWSAACPYNNEAFLIQISTLIIGKSRKQAPFTLSVKERKAINNPHSAYLLHGGNLRHSRSSHQSSRPTYFSNLPKNVSLDLLLM